MTVHKLLDTIVLARNLPAHGLLASDLGAIVEVYGPDAFEVEFVTASGRTGALVTLRAEDIYGGLRTPISSRSVELGLRLGHVDPTGIDVVDAISAERRLCPLNGAP